MLRSLALLLIILIFAISSYTIPARAIELVDVGCKPDDHVQISSQGQLITTEYAFSYRQSNCPRKRIPVDSPISLPRGDILYFWARLQGDIEYLKNPLSAIELRARFLRRIGNHWSQEKTISLRTINISRALREALGVDGLFDWRVKAERWTLDIPGEYKIYIEQGDNKICLKTSYSQECEIRFRVE